MILADELRGIVRRAPIAGIRRRVLSLEDEAAQKLEGRRRRRREYWHSWAAKNPDKVRAMRIRDREKHREKRKAQKERWRKANIEHVRVRQAKNQRAWRLRNGAVRTRTGSTPAGGLCTPRKKPVAESDEYLLSILRVQSEQLAVLALAIQRLLVDHDRMRQRLQLLEAGQSIVEMHESRRLN